MKIALIQRFLPPSPGGVGHFTHGLAGALVRRGHAVTVFSQDPAPEGAGYQVIRVMPEKAAASKLAPLTFPFYAARQNFSSFDLIHAQGDDQWLPCRRPPLVRTLHGSSLDEALANGLRGFSFKHFFLHLYFYFWELVSVLRANCVVSVSDSARRHYPRLHGVIGNGIDCRVFAPENVKKSRQPAILFVGQLAARKRGRLLVRIFQEKIRPAVPNAELWLVTPEALEGEGIRWFGRRSMDELVRLYQEAWIFCLPSSYEGFGRPYAEALAAGTPVVATPNPGACEVLKSGEYGILARDEELGDQLIALLRDEEKRNRLAQRGLARAQIYDWDVIAGEYVRVYAGLARMGSEAVAHD